MCEGSLTNQWNLTIFVKLRMFDETMTYKDLTCSQLSFLFSLKCDKSTLKCIKPTNPIVLGNWKDKHAFYYDYCFAISFACTRRTFPVNYVFLGQKFK